MPWARTRRLQALPTHEAHINFTHKVQLLTATGRIQPREFVDLVIQVLKIDRIGIVHLCLRKVEGSVEEVELRLSCRIICIFPSGILVAPEARTGRNLEIPGDCTHRKIVHASLWAHYEVVFIFLQNHAIQGLRTGIIIHRNATRNSPQKRRTAFWRNGEIERGNENIRLRTFLFLHDGCHNSRGNGNSNDREQKVLEAHWRAG